MLIVRIFCWAAFSWVSGGLTSKAAVLANYQFTSGSVASSDSDSLSTAGNFMFSGAPSSTEAAASSSTHMAYFRTSSLTSTAAGAATNNDYFSFSFTPGVGQAYNLSSLTFDFGGSNTTGGAEFTTFAFLRTNAAGDNFTTDVGGLVSKVVIAGGNENQLESFSIDLTSLSEFQNLSTATEFRFYLYSSVSNFSQILRMDNLMLNGSLVPEPSRALLMMLSVGGFSMLRRRDRV